MRDVQQLRQMKDENRQLKQLVADLSLDREVQIGVPELVTRAGDTNHSAEPLMPS